MNALLATLKKPYFLRAFGIRLALFALGWLVLVSGQLSDLWFVALSLILTVLISLWCVPPRQWLLRPRGVIAFFPYFLLTALRGGWDVARRVFLPSVPVEPDFLTFQIYPDPRKSLLLAWVISLLPGTASCLIEGDRIVVHVLDKKLPVKKEIDELRERLERLFCG